MPAPNEPTHFVYFAHQPRPTFIQDATQAELAVLGRHVAFLKENFERGKVLLAGPLLDAPQGMVIIKTTDAAEARTLMESDPAFTEGLFKFELHSLRADFL